MTKDQRLAVVLFLFGLGYFAYALRIPEFPFPVPVDSDVFPQALGVLLVLLSALLYWQGRPAQAAQAGATTAPAPDEGPFLKSPRGQLVVILIAMLIYALLLEPVGFVLVTGIFLFGIARFLGYRRHWINAAVAVGFSVGMFYIFTVTLKMNLPKGVLAWVL